MNPSLSPHEEELLLGVAAGDLTPDAPAVQAAARQSTAFAAALAEQIAVAEQLARAGRTLQAVLRDAAALPATTEDADATRSLRTLIDASPPRSPTASSPPDAADAAHRVRPPTRSLRRLPWLVAAAALLVAAWLLWWREPPVRPDEHYLGPRLRSFTAEPLRDGGGQHAGLRLRWVFELQGALRYDLVFMDTDPTRDQPLREVTGLEQPEFTLPQAEVLALPPQFRCRVRAIDPSGQVVGQGTHRFSGPR